MEIIDNELKIIWNVCNAIVNFLVSLEFKWQIVLVIIREDENVGVLHIFFAIQSLYRQIKIKSFGVCGVVEIITVKSNYTNMKNLYLHFLQRCPPNQPHTILKYHANKLIRCSIYLRDAALVYSIQILSSTKYAISR